MSIILISCTLTVSKTTRELQLFWSETETPVSVASDLKMPQFTIEKVSSTTCNEQFHLGMFTHCKLYFILLLFSRKTKTILQNEFVTCHF